MKKQGKEFVLDMRWTGVMPIMWAVLENGKADHESKQAIRDELMRLAKAMDEVNEERRHIHDNK